MNTLDESAFRIFQQMIGLGYTLYNAKCLESQTEEWYLDSRPWTSESINSHGYPVEASIFHMLWREGLLVLAKVFRDDEHEFRVYEVTSIGRTLWSAQVHRNARKEKPSPATLEIIRLVYSGSLLQVREIYREHGRVKATINNRAVHPPQFARLVKSGWIEPSDKPFNPNNNLSTWLWQWQLSAEGFEIANENFNIREYSEQPARTQFQHHEDVSAELLNALAQRIAAIIYGELTLDNELPEWFSFGRLIKKTQYIYSETQLRNREQTSKAHTSAIEAWIQESGFVRRREAQKRVGLNSHEFRTAIELGIVKPVDIPITLPPHLQQLAASIMFFDPCKLSLSEHDRGRIAQNTFLTRKQAAERLEITVAKFDKLCDQAKLRRKAVRRMRRSHWLHYRYRQSDVDNLRDLLPKE